MIGMLKAASARGWDSEEQKIQRDTVEYSWMVPRGRKMKVVNSAIKCLSLEEIIASSIFSF